MSYCRWSSDNFECDLYIYESVFDCWTIHVAGSRYVGPLPPSPSLIDLCDERISMAEYRAASDKQRAWMDEHGTTPIDLPHAGETFNLPDPGECADKVEELVALGYHCSPGVVEALREEQAELNACDSGSGSESEDAAKTAAEAVGQQPGPQGIAPNLSGWSTRRGRA